jgi:hypothetical protein
MMGQAGAVLRRPAELNVEWICPGGVCRCHRVLRLQQCQANLFQCHAIVDHAAYGVAARDLLEVRILNLQRHGVARVPELSQ